MALHPSGTTCGLNDLIRLKRENTVAKLDKFSNKPDSDEPQRANYFESDINVSNTIKIILLAEPILFNSMICVETKNRTVTLTGFVSDQHEKTHLARVVKELQSYLKVNNQVRLATTVQAGLLEGRLKY